MTKTVHLEVVLCIILKSFMLLLGKSFKMCIVNDKRFYAINKNKVSIIIRQPTVIQNNPLFLYT